MGGGTSGVRAPRPEMSASDAGPGPIVERKPTLGGEAPEAVAAEAAAPEAGEKPAE